MTLTRVCVMLLLPPSGGKLVEESADLFFHFEQKQVLCTKLTAAFSLSVTMVTINYPFMV